MSTPFTISKGNVLVDGKSVGTVEKVVHDDLWTDGRGIRTGGTEWKATTPDGEVFEGFDTRKDAAKRLAAHAEPLTVTDVKIGARMGVEFIHATVSWQGHTAIVSQYPGEEAWIVDYYVTPGSFMPAWSNGAGSRYTRARVLKDEQAVAVDAAVAESGLTIATPEGSR